MTARRYFSELRRGKSIPRALLAEACRKITLTGEGIDLGSKDSLGLQYRYMDTSAASITYTDSRPANPGVVKVDIESDLPFESQSFDFALMFYVLEHVYNYGLAISEAARVLKPGGRLIGVAPQIERFHPDPDDYFRFTTSGLRRALEDAGFREVSLKLLGLGPFTAGAHAAASATRLRLPFALTAFALDQIASTVFRKRWQETYALSIFFEART